MIKIIKNKKNESLVDVKMVLTKSQLVAVKNALECYATPTGEELSSIFDNALKQNNILE